MKVTELLLVGGVEPQRATVRSERTNTKIILRSVSATSVSAGRPELHNTSRHTPQAPWKKRYAICCRRAPAVLCNSTTGNTVLARARARSRSSTDTHPQRPQPHAPAIAPIRTASCRPPPAPLPASAAALADTGTYLPWGSHTDHILHIWLEKREEETHFSNGIFM